MIFQQFGLTITGLHYIIITRISETKTLLVFDLKEGVARLKKTVLNSRIIAPLLLGALFICLGIGSLVYVDTDIASARVMLAIILFVVAAFYLLFFIIQPICFVFEEEKLTIRYFFGFYEIIYWEKVKKAVLENMRTFFPGIYAMRFRLVTEGGTQGKKTFFTTGEIPANKKTAICMAKYLPEGMTVTDETER